MPSVERAITKTNVQQMWSRMLRTARLHSATLIDLREDKKANGQAIAVLTLASLSHGIGFAFLTGASESVLSPAGFIIWTMAWMIWFYLTVLVLSVTTFLVGTKLLRGKTTFTELVRPLFFSTSPGVLFFLVAVQNVSNAIAAFLWVWIIVIGVFAVKHAMGFSTQRSMLTFIMYFLVWYTISPGIILSLLSG
ncbi:MAG TPA: YIP1 family protein [Candidatus Bathyarchaeia archaeon]